MRGDPTTDPVSIPTPGPVAIPTPGPVAIPTRGPVSVDDLTATLVAVVGILLGLDDLDGLDADSNFIEEGGHSLLAVELDERVHALFGARLDIPLLYRGTLREVAAAITGFEPTPALAGAEPEAS